MAPQWQWIVHKQLVSISNDEITSSRIRKFAEGTFDVRKYLEGSEYFFYQSPSW